MSEKFILAPIRGVTNYIYREAYSRFFENFDYALTPFLATNANENYSEKFLKDVLPQNNRLTKVVPQILGKDGEEIVLLSNQLYDIGFEEVNWNLGCPHKMVAKRKRGSGLLPHPKLIDEILETIFERIEGRFSVKIRLGRESSEEVDSLIPIFNKFPISEVIIHARTGIQMYEGTVDISSFEKCYKKFVSEVAYNGDIFKKEDFEKLKKKFPEINKWMIGRGALVNPFLLSEIKQNFVEESRKKEILYKFHNEILSENINILSGDHHILGRMKEFWSYLVYIFENEKKHLKKIQKSQNIEKYKKEVDYLFEEELKIGHNYYRQTLEI